MKKLLSIFMSLILVLTCLCGTTVFAAETESVEAIATAETIGNEIVPRGTLEGYGSHWYNSGEKMSGEFNVVVTGSSWTSAQTTLSIANFGSKVRVQMKVYRPDGSLAYDSLATTGDFISMSNKDTWNNIPFLRGQVGTYKVRWAIHTTDNSTPTSGRLMCWIY